MGLSIDRDLALAELAALYNAGVPEPVNVPPPGYYTARQIAAQLAAEGRPYSVRRVREIYRRLAEQGKVVLLRQASTYYFKVLNPEPEA